MDGFDDIESLDDEKTADQVSEEDEEEIGMETVYVSTYIVFRCR